MPKPLRIYAVANEGVATSSRRYAEASLKAAREVGLFGVPGDYNLHCLDQVSIIRQSQTARG